MDIKKLIKPFEEINNAKLFSCKLVKVYATPAFGAISKTEIDNLVFGLLVETGALNPKSQVYEIARDLNVTPAKARNLLFQWQLRSMEDGNNLKDDLISALQSVRFAKDGDYMSFGIESPLLREELRSRLKRIGVYPDASFSSELIRLSVRHFVDFLDNFLDKETKKSLQKQLVKDHHLADKSFKGIAFRVLKGVAKKAAGEVGAELTDLFGDAVKGLLTGDSGDVNTAVKGIDLTDEALIYV